MALPFSNGAELANALGYGKMYQDAKQQDMEKIKGVQESFKASMWKLDGIFKRNIQETYD